jgi:GNAT superfamily N-acetyltransferase
MLTYSKTVPGDARELARLYRLYLNGGDGIGEWMEKGLALPGFCGVKCLDDGEIVGVVTAKPGVEFTCGHHELAREIEERWRGFTLYTADMGLVTPSHRGRGIAKELMRRVRDELLLMGCTRVVAELWLRGGEDSPILHTVRECWGETRELGLYPDFYRELGKYGMTCPHCGGGECSCGALVCMVALTRESLGRKGE